MILAGPLRGEVVETTAAGFLVRNTAAINAPPANVYAALTDKVGGWWDPAHTFSHDARNLSLEARAGGCFCERLPDGGGVQHMRVVYASPGKLLRLTGAIGPLQEAALAGTMTWNLLQAGSGTTVELSYTVGGFRAGVGVRQLGDRPMSKLHFWSIRTNVSPEAYIDLRIEPGQEANWRITYKFYRVR